MRFKDKIVLVVGSATGMGRETVKRLVEEGAHVIAYDIRDDELETLSEEVKGAAGTFEPFIADVNNAEKRKEVVAFIQGKYGKLDTLAYVAGVYDFMTPAHRTDDELWDYVMDVNVNSVFRMVREVLPLLKDHKDSQANILIVGSVGGIFNSTAGAAYIASKHAVRGLAKNLAYTYRKNNIRVNVVNPGSHATGITENALLKWPDRDLIDDEGMNLYIQKGSNSINECQLGDPEGIASAICYLISDEANYVCGAELTVDGGWTSF